MNINCERWCRWKWTNSGRQCISSVLYEKVVGEMNSQQHEETVDVGKEHMDTGWERIKRIVLQDAADAHGVIKYEEENLVEWWRKSGNG